MMTECIYNADDFQHARQLAGSYLVITGDSGFEAYLTVPFHAVKADVHTISVLMLDLESLEQTSKLFPGDVSPGVFAGYDAWLEYGIFVPGDKVTARGEITGSLWLSPLFDKFSIWEQVWQVLSGDAPRLKNLAGKGQGGMALN